MKCTGKETVQTQFYKCCECNAKSNKYYNPIGNYLVSNFMKNIKYVKTTIL